MNKWKKLINKNRNKKDHTSNSESIATLYGLGFDVWKGEVNGILLEKLGFMESVWLFGRFVWGGDVTFRGSVITERVNRDSGARTNCTRWIFAWVLGSNK
jgi:hypothetical protein